MFGLRPPAMIMGTPLWVANSAARILVIIPPDENFDSGPFAKSFMAEVISSISVISLASGSLPGMPV